MWKLESCFVHFGVCAAACCSVVFVMLRRWQSVIHQRLMKSSMQYRTARERQWSACFTTTSETRWVHYVTTIGHYEPCLQKPVLSTLSKTSLYVIRPVLLWLRGFVCFFLATASLFLVRLVSCVFSCHCEFGSLPSAGCKYTMCNYTFVDFPR